MSDMVNLLCVIIQVMLIETSLAETDFRIGCSTTLVASLTDPNIRLGPTLMVIISAFASEYCGRLSIPPIDVLRGLAGRLSSYTRKSMCILSITII